MNKRIVKEKQILVEFIKFLGRNPKYLEDGLHVLFTLQELKELNKRLLILNLLLLGYSQREVANKLKVGIATVTRGSKELQLKRSYVIKEFFKTRGQEYWRVSQM